MEIELKKTLIALFATASVFAGVSAASAAGTEMSSTGQLIVTAKLQNGCGINFDAGGKVDFDNVTDLSNGQWSGDHTFTVKCTNAMKTANGTPDTNGYVPTSVALNAGNGTNSAISDRTMNNLDNTSAAPLHFQVFQGAPGASKIWGDGSAADVPAYTLDGGASGVYHYSVKLNNVTDMSALTVGTYQATMTATLTYTANPKGA